MYKRPEEIEEAIDIVDNATFDYSNGAIHAWNKVVNYIEQLEKCKEDFLNEKIRILDDGK